VKTRRSFYTASTLSEHLDRRKEAHGRAALDPRNSGLFRRNRPKRRKRGMRPWRRLTRITEQLSDDAICLRVCLDPFDRVLTGNRGWTQPVSSRSSGPVWHEGDGDPPRWIFRGHRNAAWRLNPRAWRTAAEGDPLHSMISKLASAQIRNHDDVKPGTTLHRALAWTHAERLVLNEFRRIGWRLGFEVDEPSSSSDGPQLRARRY
jgi:hypothetical protein